MSKVFPAFIELQLALLDAHEKTLEHLVMNEAQLNEMLKRMLTSLLPVLRAKRVLIEELVAAHRECVAKRRRRLEALRDSEGKILP